MSVDELNDLVDDDRYEPQDVAEPDAEPELDAEPGEPELAEALPEATALGYAEDSDDAEDFEPVADVEATDAVEPEPVERTEAAVFVDPMPALESVGHPDVDAVVERLGELEQLPIDEHIEVYEDAHRRLHETLLAAGEDSGSA